MPAGYEAVGVTERFTRRHDQCDRAGAGYVRWCNTGNMIDCRTGQSSSTRCVAAGTAHSRHSSLRVRPKRQPGGGGASQDQKAEMASRQCCVDGRPERPRQLQPETVEDDTKRMSAYELEHRSGRERCVLFQTVSQTLIRTKQGTREHISRVRVVRLAH